MRVLKFRAWHAEAKDMVFFGLGEDHFKAYSLEEDINYTLDLEHGHPVMQYTGLNDKNGKEIYEGDILEYSGDSKVYEKIKVVEWIDKSAFIGFLIARNIEYEIIGNIYANPELLEGN